MTQTSKRLDRANKLLDKACQAAGLDPIETRLTMAQTITDRLQATQGKGYGRNGAERVIQHD